MIEEQVKREIEIHVKKAVKNALDEEREKQEKINQQKRRVINTICNFLELYDKEPGIIQIQVILKNLHDPSISTVVEDSIQGRLLILEGIATAINHFRKKGKIK